MIVVGVIIIAKVSEPLSQKQQLSLDVLNRITRENLSGLKVIRAFNNDAYEQARFNKTNEEFTGYTRKIFKLMLLTQPVFYFS